MPGRHSAHRLPVRWPVLLGLCFGGAMALAAALTTTWGVW